MSELIKDFYRQNEWANLELVDACRSLTDEQLDATAVGTFGSIRDTLSHIVSAEGGYAVRLGHPPTPRLGADDPWAGFDALAEMVSEAAKALMTAASDPPRTIRVGSDTKYDVETPVILIQAFHHSTEHRSQVLTILTTLGFEPSELSSWDWALAVDRIRKV